MNEAIIKVSEKRTDWPGWLVATTVFIASFIVFYLTKAPTLSFWDCGEFVACASILGIPHPPGSPLFVILGRVAVLLPTADDPAVRVNLISVLSSALTAWMGYRIVRRLIKHWISEEATKLNRYWAELGGFCGGLMLGFSSTFWSSAVEAEVYGSAMFLFLLISDLTLQWFWESDPRRQKRLLALIFFLGVLSAGFHMTAFMVMPGVVLLLVLKDKQLLADWRFWVTGLIMLMLIIAVVPFLFSLATWLVITLIASFLNPRNTRWSFALVLTIVVAVGFSCQLYIPIRSTQNPTIDENDPETLGRFKNFLERKQYGQVNMLTRMFHRRGSLANQFGTHERMGFWGFFNRQYGTEGAKFLLLFALGLWGAWYQIRRVWEAGFFCFLLLFLGTVGLVLYMNFADGSHLELPEVGTGNEIAPLEVRDRDYFWTPGFIWFALFIGIGLVALAKVAVERLKESSVILRGAIIVVSTVVGIFLPINSAISNWFTNSRAGDYLPYDYAAAILNSLDKDAIVFTNGDNDTFPLWALQNTYRIRQDVRNINLSLINTDWYILQFKNQWGVPMTLTEKQIEWTDYRLPDGRPFPRPAEPYYDPVRKSTHYLAPFLDENNRIIRTQDLMIEHIVTANRWKYPIYFSRTVQQDNRVGLNRYLRGEGMGMRIVPDTSQAGLDLERTEKLLWDVYRFRGLSEPDVTKDDNTASLFISFPELAIDLYNNYLQKGDTARAVLQLERAVQRFPDYYRSVLLLANYFKTHNQPARADSVYQNYLDFMQKVLKRMPDNTFYRQYLSAAYHEQGNKEKAYEVLKMGVKRRPENSFLVHSLMSLYAVDGKTKEAVAVARQWLKREPNNPTALQIISTFGQ